jgi:hypothetical protein
LASSRSAQRARWLGPPPRNARNSWRLPRRAATRALETIKRLWAGRPVQQALDYCSLLRLLRVCAARLGNQRLRLQGVFVSYARSPVAVCRPDWPSGCGASEACILLMRHLGKHRKTEEKDSSRQHRLPGLARYSAVTGGQHLTSCAALEYPRAHNVLHDCINSTLEPDSLLLPYRSKLRYRKHEEGAWSPLQNKELDSCASCSLSALQPTR